MVFFREQVYTKIARGNTTIPQSTATKYFFTVFSYRIQNML